MSLGRYALGVGALLIVVGSLGIAAVATRRRYAPAWSGAPARLAEIVVALALLTAELELLGTLRLFRLVPLIVVSLVVGLLISRALVGGRAGADCAAAARGAALPWRPVATTLAVGVIAGVVVLAEWAGPTFKSFDFGIRGFDSLWYHLPWSASFAQTGQITGLRFTDVEYLTAFYPATAEMFHGAGIVLLSRDTLSPILNLFWLGATLLAGYCVGWPRGLGGATMAAAALAAALPTLVLSQAGSAANDIVGVFFVLAAAALLFAGSEESLAIVLGGLAAGLAVGVKLTMVAPALALSVGAIVTFRRRAHLWLIPLTVAGGFWYLRNLIAVGNPLPWLHLPGLPTPAPPPQAGTGFSVAHYLFSSHAWSAFFQPGLAAGLGPWWWAIVAFVLLGPLLCLLPGAEMRLRMLALSALVSLLVYVLTPESAAGPSGQPLGFAFNLRYAAPGLALALTILPLAPALRRGRGQLCVLAMIGAALLATLAQARLWPSHELAPALALTAIAVVVAATGLRSAPAALAAAAAVLVFAGYPIQRHYLAGRYAYQPGVSSLSGAWALFRHIHDARVGVVGTFGGFFTYPFYGIDLSNRVQYVGERGHSGSFTPIASCRAWRTALNAAGLRYVVTTPARDPWHPRRLMPSPEGGWTASDPAARLVYRRRATGETIAVYLLRGPLNPSACG